MVLGVVFSLYIFWQFVWTQLGLSVEVPFSICISILLISLVLTHFVYLCLTLPQWSGKEVTAPAAGVTLTVPAPIGFPPVFYQKGSVYGAQLREYLLHMGYTVGYEWDYAECSTAGNESGSGGTGKVGENITTDGDSTKYAVPVVIFVLLLALGVAAHFVFVQRRKAHGNVVGGGAVYERLSSTEELSAGLLPQL